MTNDEEGLISLEDLARKLALTPKAVKALQARGAFPSVKLSHKHRLFAVADIKAYLAKNSYPARHRR